MKKRSECKCQCHTSPDYRHITACCEPDRFKVNPFLSRTFRLKYK